jgi:hypothetical protein
MGLRSYSPDVPTSLPDVLARFSTYVQGRVDSWRTGSSSSQLYVLALLLLLVAATLVASWYATDSVPLTIWFLWLLLGMLVLRFAPLAVLCAAVFVSSLLVTFHEGFAQPYLNVGLLILVLAIAVILFHASRQKSGLPVALSEPMLAQLRDRLQAQGRMPDLPGPWRAQSALLTAHGTSYAGDFLVTDVQDDRWLEVVMVDVCGKGVAVGAQALQFSGALGGLIGALPPAELMQAANAFLLRQDSEESFATAAHLLVDLETGDYMIISAGHPPALRWERRPGGWFVDNARGTALGVIPSPDLVPSTGTLRPGEALMFYTDGVVEARGRDLDEGTDWLRGVALNAVLSRGFNGLPRRVLRQVPSGADDRALLVLERLPDPQ